MDPQLAHIAALSGMIGGPAAAISIIESSQNHIHGTADKWTLSLPRPRDKETLETTRDWGFVWPENDHAYDRQMSRRASLTVEVLVPNGWSVTSSDHWLYKNLLDEKGQVRASLMIHVQDHDSWLSITDKYRVSHWSKRHGDDEPIWPTIQDSNGNVVWVGERIEPESGYFDRLGKFWEDRRAGKNPGEEEPKSPLDRATAAARAQLATWGINPSDQKWFEEGFDFPPLNDTRPVVKAYRVYTEFRHNPNDHYAADQGSSEMLATDDKEAIAEMEKTRARSSGYHRNWVLYNEKGKEIWRGEDKRPVPKGGRFGKGKGGVYTYYDCDYNRW